MLGTKKTSTSCGARLNGHLVLQTVLSVLSCLAIILFMVVPHRHLFFLEDAPRNTFGFPLIIAVALLVLICSFLWPKLTKYSKGPNNEDIEQYNWPLIALCLFNIAFALMSFVNVTVLELYSSGRSMWGWTEFILLQFASLCAWYIGRKASSLGNKALGITFVIGLSFMLTFSLGEYLHLSGFANPIGAWIGSLNEAAPYSVWIWHDFEAVRAQGLARTPALYAFFSLVGFCWALASQNLHKLRAAVAILSIYVCYLSGSRTAYVAFFIVAIAFLFIYLWRKELFSWLRRNIKQLIPIVSILLLLLGGTYALTGQHHFDRNVPADIEVLVHAEQNHEVLPENEIVLAESDHFESDSAILYILHIISSGRIAVWQEAIEVIEQNPLGTWQISSSVLSVAHSHNDFIERWLIGGPIAFALFLWFIWWLLWRARAPHAPLFPVLLGIALISFGTFETVFAQIAFAPVALFALGFLATSRKYSRKK